MTKVSSVGPVSVHRSQVEMSGSREHVLCASDPYGCNEKKRKKENVMRMSGLTGK